MMSSPLFGAHVVAKTGIIGQIQVVDNYLNLSLISMRELTNCQPIKYVLKLSIKLVLLLVNEALIRVISFLL